MSDPSAENPARRDFLSNSVAAALGSSITLAPLALASEFQTCMPPASAGPADIIIINLRKLENVYGGFPVNQLDHMLQTATYARKAGESPEIIVASLCHDMGKVISDFNHEEIAAEMLKPYVSDPVYNMMKYHGIFQGRFYWGKIFRDPKLYLKFKSEPWYDLAMKFTGEYDKPAFKRPSNADTLESFIPVIRQVVGS